MATSPEPPRGARLAPLLLLPLAWATLFHRIGAAPLLDTDEPRYAGPARDIARGADPVLPQFNGRLRLNKPILYYWLAAASYRIVGDQEAAGRLVSALATAGTAGIAALLARRAAGARAGLLAAAVFLTTFYTPFLGRLATTDALLAFWVGLAIWCHARHGPAGFARVRDAVPFWVALGLAALTKGPVGILIPLFVVLASIAGRGFLARAAALRPLPGLLVFLAVAAPWYAAVPLRIGWTPAWNLLWSETAERYFAGEKHQEGLAFVPMILLAGFLPWIGHLPLAALHARARPPGLRLPLAWIAVVVVFFSLTKSKLPSYVASAFVPLSVLTGLALDALPGMGPRAWCSASWRWPRSSFPW
jgi:4-amino-4-deoxy-L-arabinose transferase-like glycosyltransferase